MGDVLFAETDPAREVVFTSLEVAALRRARHGLTIEEVGRLQPDAVRVRIGPRTGYAGTVSLPSGRRVVVRPKAQIDSIPQLLALAYRTLAPPVSAGRASVEAASPAEWLLVQLAGEVHELLARGLRRGYVERRERLPYVRGRTRPVLNPADMPFLDCEYADFVTDTPENQLLRGVLELLGPAVRNRHLRRYFDDATSYLRSVSLVRPSPAHFDRLRLNRLNQHYGPSLRLARLALEGAGVEDASGGTDAPAYFVLMWQVWENAVASALKDAGVRDLVQKPRYSHAFVHDNGRPNSPITIEPDLVLGPRSKPRLVIDLKWGPVLSTDRYGRRRLRSSHLYQIATYSTALDADAILMYPFMGDDVATHYTFNGHRISVQTIDLNVPQLGALREAAAAIASA